MAGSKGLASSPSPAAGGAGQTDSLSECDHSHRAAWGPGQCCLETPPQGTGWHLLSCGLFSEKWPVFSVDLCWDVCSAAPCSPLPHAPTPRDRAGDWPGGAHTRQGHGSALSLWFLPGLRGSLSPEEGTWGDSS